MSRWKTGRRRLGRYATPRRLQVLIATIAALSLFTGWTMLAYSGALDTVFKRKGKKAGTVSLQSFNSNSPSKEYIYAGGRLVATEEPAGSSGCGSPPPSPGNSLLATAQSTTSVLITWSQSQGAHHYEVERRANINASWSHLTPDPLTNSFTDNGVVADTTYLYRVRAVDVDGQCPSQYSNVDLATTVTFTSDPPVAIGTIIYAVHLTRLRIAVNAVRTAAVLPPFDWSDPSLPVTVTPVTGGNILKDQVQKLRNRLNEARSALSLPPQPYSNEPLTAGIKVFADHILELRNGVK